MEDHFDPYHKWLGIPPKDQPANHYRLLGIELLESDPDVIENGADQRMRHIRSLQHGAHVAQSQKLLNEIAAAKICLLNPKQKAQYDSKLVPDDASAEPAMVMPVFSTSEASVHRSAPTQPLIRRAKKKVNPVAEAVKIIVGGVVGLGIGFLILSFLREDWDMLGIAKSMRGTKTVAQRSDNSPSSTGEKKPPVVKPEPGRTDNVARPQTTNPSQEKPKVVDPPSTNTSKEPPKVVDPGPAKQKLPSLEGIVEKKTFVWERGKEAIDLGPASDSFIVTSGFAGHFLGNGEWYRADIDDQGNYRLNGGGARDVNAKVTRVRSPYRAWFEDKVEQFSWKKGKERVRLIHQNDGFPVLSGATGCFLDGGHVVSLFVDPADGYWYLDGKTNFDTRGHAFVYRFKRPGEFRPEYQVLDWKPGDASQNPLTLEEGLCGISSISGAFKGFGEGLSSVVNDDGYWQVSGNSQAGSTRGSFVCLRFTTPEMLALSSGEPNIKTPLPMPETPPVKPKGKGPPPSAEAITAAQEKLKELVAKSDLSALLEAAAKDRPAEESYVLLIAARDSSAATGDCPQTMRVSNMLADAFEIDRFDHHTATLVKLRDGCTTPDANLALANLFLEHLDRAIEEKKATAIESLAEMAIVVARKANAGELERRATLRLLQSRKKEGSE